MEFETHHPGTPPSWTIGPVPLGRPPLNLDVVPLDVIGQRVVQALSCIHRRPVQTLLQVLAHRVKHLLVVFVDEDWLYLLR